ncbi:MAG: DUF222 domain-containing protein [Microthrixaceae bacterium]
MTGQCEHNDNGNNDGGVLGGLGRLGESVGVLAAVDPRRLGDEELLDAAVGLAAVQRRLDAAEARLLGELEARDVPDRVHGHRTSGWLAAATGQPAAHTKSRVRTANALRQHFGLFAEALGEGRVGWAYCRALQNASNDRILPGLVELQEYLLSRVPGRRFERWAAELRALCAELDEDGPEPEAGERDSLVISETGGVTVISGCVHGSEGEELSQAIEAETERLYRRAQADAKACPDLVVPGWMTLRAKALLELIRRAQHTCTTNGRQAGADITLIVHAEQTQPTDTDDPAEQPPERANGAGPVTGSASNQQPPERANGSEPGAGPASGPAGTAASDPAESQTDESGGAGGVPSGNIAKRFQDGAPAVPPGGNNTGGHASEPWMGPVFRPDGTPLAHTPGTVDANLWRLCCAANIRSFVVDGDDLPIWATLNQRLASPLQRRMVLVRDGGCVFPGCDAPLAWIQIHHVIPAAAGGPTEPTNLAALCAHHHGVTHRTGWHMTANTGPTGLPNGRFTWTTPTGHTIDSQRHQAWQPPEQPEDGEHQPVPPTPIRTRRAPPPNRPPGYPDTG